MLCNSIKSVFMLLFLSTSLQNIYDWRWAWSYLLLYSISLFGFTRMKYILIDWTRVHPHPSCNSIKPVSIGIELEAICWCLFHSVVSTYDDHFGHVCIARFREYEENHHLKQSNINNCLRYRPLGLRAQPCTIELLGWRYCDHFGHVCLARSWILLACLNLWLNWKYT